MTESSLYPAIIGALSNGNTRVFRQQSALAWQGTVVSHTHERLVLAYPRAIRSGCPGMADLGGLTAIEVTEADIGRTLAVYLAIECKAGRARPTAEQAAFLETVQRLGARAGIARSVEDARAIIGGLNAYST